MSAKTKTSDVNQNAGPRSELWLSIAMLSIIVVLIVPLPAVLVDMLLAVNLGFSILLLLVTLSARRPMDVAVFPSLLLLTTLFRLSLNVATTRLILLNGDAGKIVSTFGDFIVGGQLIVGIVIFLILVVIQFIVITKGAGRISEVNARFTLDALPGKQMAIDAELASGSIDQDEARELRTELASEAEFFGAMDGAGKYVRGDSIAGLLITLVNLVGGILIGTTQKGLSFGEAAELYSVLTIGDGLISQIPALIIATTAGFLITKSSTETQLGHELGQQLFHKRRPLISGGVILLVLAMTPGLPKIPFIILAIAAFVIANKLKNQTQEEEKPAAEQTQEPQQSPDDMSLEHFVNSDRICIQIGASLIPFVEQPDGQGLKKHIAGVRTELNQRFGLWVPKVRIRDVLTMDSDAYRISIAGRTVAESQVIVDELLAIDSGNSQMDLHGRETRDPSFGIKAFWIPESQKRRAEFGGYTVVDAMTVVGTHLRTVIRRHAHELLGREDLQKMLNKISEHSPTIIEELKPDIVRQAVLHKVLVLLLEEKVPINNLELILESIVQHGAMIKEPEPLTDLVRADIGAVICENYRTAEGRIRVLVLDQGLEHRLKNLMHEGRLALQPGPLQRLVEKIRQASEASVLQEQPIAVLVDGMFRRPHCAPRSVGLWADVAVISYMEIPTDVLIEPAGFVQPHEMFRRRCAS